MHRTLLLLILVAPAYLQAQQLTVSGNIKDTGENVPLANAVVSLISPKDSILIKFTRTAADGSFIIRSVPSAPFILLVTYPGYADYVDNITPDGSTLALGGIPLIKKSELLEAVIVRRQLSAIRMKGDTLEYKADSFKVSQGATVDELLKQLPGIQVDRNGGITAQGQKVNKVLVDGEEFFSDDPAVVIKNLQAEAVQDVQVFDKKSDQAEFTGIDDGERSKTINLTLKPDKKKGYFAKGNVNAGTNEAFDNNLMLNSFKGNKKIAAFGIISNTGQIGLGWQDNDRFGGGFDLEYNEEYGYYSITDYDNEFNQQMNEEEGLPTAWSAGLHFSDKWNNDKKKINTNYRFLKKNLTSEASVLSQYILPDTQYFNNQVKRAFSSRTGHQLRGVYEIKFDSLSSMKISLNGKMSVTDNASRINSESLNADSALVNYNNRLLSSQVEKNNFTANILWRKRFKTKGRTLSVNFEQQAMEQQLEGTLNSQTGFYNSGGIEDRSETIDQRKDNTQNNIEMNTNIVYTEPLSKTLFLSVNYGYNFFQNEAFRKSFNKGSDDDYTKLDSLLSNDFRFRYSIHRAGADLKLNRKKLMMIIGSGLSHSGYRQTDLVKDSARKYSFINYSPKIFLKLTPKPQRTVSFNYSGRNNPPSLEQLQPVFENTDPLNIQLGNPSLRQEFVHSLSLNFNDYKIISERGIYSYLYSTITNNAISTSTVVDEGGKTTYQPINVKGNYMVGFYGGYSWKLKKPGIGFDLGTQLSVNRNSNRVNELANVNEYQSGSLSLNISKRKNDQYQVSIRPAIGFTRSESSLRPDVVISYLTSASEVSVWTKLPWKFEFWSAAYINLRGKTDAFDRNRNVVKWDANIVKKLLKNNNLEIKLAVFDLLDQNIGFNRTVNSNLIYENNFTTLRRYFMLGLQYNISKNP